MNYEAQRLLPHEIQAMKTSKEVIRRLTRSYEIMLDFYGMALLSEETGLVGRSLPPRNYTSRYKNLLREYT